MVLCLANSVHSLLFDSCTIHVILGLILSRLKVFPLTPEFFIVLQVVGEEFL